MDWLEKYDDFIQDDDNGGYSTPTTTKRATAAADEERKPRTMAKSRLIEEEDEEEEVRRVPRKRIKQEEEEEDGGRGDVQFTQRVVKAPRDQHVYPSDVRFAAEVLTGYQDDFPFASAPGFSSFITFLEMITSQADSSTVIDPPIIMYYVYDTVVNNVYFREVIPVSTYMMLLALHAKFSLRITPRATTEPIDMEQFFIKAPSASSSKGTSTGVVKAATFNANKMLKDLLDELENGYEIAEQVGHHMYSLGPMNPRDACSFEFIEAQKEVISQIIQGDYKVAVPRPTSAKKK